MTPFCRLVSLRDNTHMKRALHRWIGETSGTSSRDRDVNGSSGPDEAGEAEAGRDPEWRAAALRRLRELARREDFFDEGYLDEVREGWPE